jgi:hypothetical protein
VLKVSVLILLLVVTWVVNVFHIGTAPPPLVTAAQEAAGSGRFIDKKQHGVHQLIVSGDDFARGHWAGKLTKDLLLEQETTLDHFFVGFFRNPLSRFFLQIFLIRWFWGEDQYIPEWAVREMYGVSLSSPRGFEKYGSGLTRQVIYHGLHDAGQMMVDNAESAWGCTVFGIPYEKKWIIGRNFDFEGGEVFDREKILKWVFPTDGQPYVSVIWAGMVGAVTGVNQSGVYVSINAAGSADFHRLGTPTSLVVTEALQHARSAREAVEIIRAAQVFITDIFVVADREGAFFRVEKSPGRTGVQSLTSATVITNHLEDPIFAADVVNKARREQLTSVAREERGTEILSRRPDFQSSAQTSLFVLSALRDKKAVGNEVLTLGNRKAIDALIATHSAIYDSHDFRLFVSEGPNVSGAFMGVDLQKSFASREPVFVDSLPRDPQLSDDDVLRVRELRARLAQARNFLAAGNCAAAEGSLYLARGVGFENYSLLAAEGDQEKCAGHYVEAVKKWTRALELKPAYLAEVTELKRKIQAGTRTP